MHDIIRRSLALFPAGSNGEFDLPAELATVIERGEGCRVWTVDGREMLDFSMGWGSALAGHGNVEIGTAVTGQILKGANFAYISRPSLQLAEEVVRVSPACDQVRFCVSGSEATMYCLRIARAYTQRTKILKFEGAYHGFHDVGVASLFPALEPNYPVSHPGCDGVDLVANSNILVAPFNDIDSARKIICDHRSQLACIIVEPFQRCIAPRAGFLAALREFANDSGAQLIFDETVTGFRLAYGGAQELYGVVPDLVSYGKALGGGLAIAAFGGRQELMQLVREDRLGRSTYVWTASTLGGNPVSAAASIAALRQYREPGVYDRLRRLGEVLREELRRALASQPLPAQVLGDGPLAQIAFTDEHPVDYRSSRHKHPEFARRVMLELSMRNVFLNPMGTKLYLSLSHTDEDCMEFGRRFAAALAAAR